ncbi:MAG: CapA family protein [bacterium]
MNFLAPKTVIWERNQNLEILKDKTVVTPNAQINNSSIPLSIASSSSGVRLLFFGDLMLDRWVRQLIDKNGLDSIFDGLSQDEGSFFKNYDFVGANLEGVVTDKGNHYSPVYANDFAFRPEDVRGLSKYNFNIFNVANNHVTDQGVKAEVQSRKKLIELGFANFGCHDRLVGDCSSLITHTGSTTISWLGFSQVYGVLDQAAVVQQITKAKKLADFVVVNIHWGSEYQAKFNQTQQRLGHAMVEAGADVVIGHHPHVVQGVEKYQNRLIFYSLGNFIFDQYFSTKTQQGLALGIILNNEKLAIDIYPLALGRTSPRQIQGVAKQRAFNELANISAEDDTLRSQIKNGKIVISNIVK